MMNCELELQTVYGQLQKHLVLLERCKRNMKSMDWWGFLLTCTHTSMLIMYLINTVLRCNSCQLFSSQVQTCDFYPEF